jgi:hypothetical protein
VALLALVIATPWALTVTAWALRLPPPPHVALLIVTAITVRLVTLAIGLRRSSAARRRRRAAAEAACASAAAAGPWPPQPPH